MGNSEVERKQEIITSQMEDSSADSSRKIRKPYTISKSRESWTDVEHDKFIEALQLFDRDWRKIEAFIGSKTVIQIRSHAQKYFKKVEKSGTSEHLPPPRPKRKASHPYPQKAPKNAQNEASLSIRNSNNCSSIDSISDPAENYKNTPSLHGTPDFAQVYSFLGSLFDPNTSDHLQKLKKMDSINIQTILLLMRNLSINLTSPDFEPHRKLLATYSADSEEYNRSSSNQSLLHIGSFGSLVQSK